MTVHPLDLIVLAVSLVAILAYCTLADAKRRQAELNTLAYRRQNLLRARREAQRAVTVVR